MPRAGDLIGFHVESNPVPTKTNPLGVKGAGEAGCVGALPAVANALVDALSVLGIKHIDLPATPERLWRAIHEARAKGGISPRSPGRCRHLLRASRVAPTTSWSETSPA